MEKRFQILSLSGGGYMGLYTASVLEKLEDALGEPIASRFDLIAGTSIGGVIGLGLAAGVPAKRIREAISTHGPHIFSTHPPREGIGAYIDLLSFFGHAKYRQERLREAIEEIVGSELKMGELQHRILVPTVNLSTGKPQVFKTPHHATFVRDKDLRVAEVALATSAAPTYLPLAEISGALYADGGLYANSPDFMAFHEARHFLEVPQEGIWMMSIGTTSSNFSFSHAGGKDLGWSQWMTGNRLPSVMIASQQFIADIMMRHTIGDHYFRVDELQSKEQERTLGLDVASDAATRDLVALAEASVQRILPSSFVQEIFKNKAEELKFT